MSFGRFGHSARVARILVARKTTACTDRGSYVLLRCFLPLSRSGNKLIVVGFLEQLHDVFGILALLQESAEGFVA